MAPPLGPYAHLLPLPSPPSPQHTPSIGLLVVFLSFTGQPWEELCPGYLQESMARNVRRIVQKQPELDTAEPDPK